MTSLALLARHGVDPHLQSMARIACAAAFLLVLAGLGFSLWRTRKEVRECAAEAALESNFRELERALAEPEPTRLDAQGGRSLEAGATSQSAGRVES